MTAYQLLEVQVDVFDNTEVTTVELLQLFKSEMTYDPSFSEM